jgi:hypothetical protein
VIGNGHAGFGRGGVGKGLIRAPRRRPYLTRHRDHRRDLKVLADVGANIVTSDQYSTDPEGGTFFLRMEFHLEALEARLPDVVEHLSQVVSEFEMSCRVTRSSERKRVAVFASRYDHCLLDLLWRWRRGELEMDIIAVDSNHPDLQEDRRKSRRSASRTTTSRCSHRRSRRRRRHSSSCLRERSTS